MRQRLTPKPHILKSKRNKRWTLAGAIHELIDNSIGHGKAKNISVIVDNKNGIEVIDDGIGVDNINRVFWFGDASGTDDLAEIGQYGVGAKDAAVYLGDVTTVETIHKGRHHKMTINWKQVERSGQWPLAYTGAGRLANSDECGTKIKIAKLARRH